MKSQGVTKVIRIHHLLTINFMAIYPIVVETFQSGMTIKWKLTDRPTSLETSSARWEMLNDNARGFRGLCFGEDCT